MITGTLRSQIDKLWTEFWTGGITNPLTVIEQISFLMFSRLLDIAETRAEKRAARLGRPVQGQFGPGQQHLRWSNYKNLPAEQMLKVIRDEVFPHFRSLGDGESTFAEYVTDARLLVQKPSLLVSAVNMPADGGLGRAEADRGGGRPGVRHCGLPRRRDVDQPLSGNRVRGGEVRPATGHPAPVTVAR